MKLSHLLADSIRTERENQIAARRLVSEFAAYSSKVASRPPAAEAVRWLGRLLPAR